MKREPARADGVEFDLLIVGGGINGAGIARDAAMRGLRVALVDKGDFGSGTSSRSSKLVHGGLRYLEHGHIRLVFEALREQATLLAIAPHLVRPLDFVVPVGKSSRHGLLSLRLGLAFYDFLARRADKRHAILDRSTLLALEPLLRTADTQAGASYGDCQVDDARLVLANLVDAEEHGAVVLNYTEVTAFLHRMGRLEGVRVRDRLSLDDYELRARLVVNATGPWADVVAAMAGESQRQVMLSRGTHLVFPRFTAKAALLLQVASDGRVFFAIPWGDTTLVGTTETEFQEPPDKVEATHQDVSYLMGAMQRSIGSSVDGLRPLTCFSALRPLVSSRRRMGSASREHRLSVGRSGLLTLVGGKLTTYRHLAQEVCDRVLAQLGQSPRRASTAKHPLPGGAIADLAGFEESSVREGAVYGLTRPQVLRLVAAHGSRVQGLYARLREQPRLTEPLCPHTELIGLDVDWATRHEAAHKLEDVFLRRTRAGHQGCLGRDAADTAVALMADAHGWSETRRISELEDYSRSVTNRTQPIIESLGD